MTVAVAPYKRRGKKMRRTALGLVVTAGMYAALFSGSVAHATQTVDWTGNGLDSVTQCIKGVDHAHLHWVLTPGGDPVPGTTAELFINGMDVGTMISNGPQGALQLTISVPGSLTLDQLANAEVHSDILTGSVGDNAVLTISDGCLCHT
jgi:hypothetical protein